MLRTATTLLCLLLAGKALAQTEPPAPPSKAPPAPVVAWVKRVETPVSTAAAEPGPAEAAAIDRMVAGARVIGFGESNHGNREPLVYRNRLIRHLVTHDGLTAVALESGLAESRQLFDYVLGGAGDPEALTRAGLTHGFGVLRENVELVEWLRGWNAAHPRRPVHLYGIDLSTIQSAPPNAHGYGVVLGQLDAYLARTAPAETSAMRARLAAYVDRFTENDYPAWSAADRTKAASLLAEVDGFLVTHRTSLIRSSSELDWAWAEREAHDARRLLDAFATWTNDPRELKRLSDLIAVRDLAMADNLQWALAREGPRGKILLFQANGHIAAAPLVGSVMRLFPAQPKVTGTVLRERMGSSYRAIGTVSSRGRDADDPTLGSVDRAFAAASLSPALLDLRSPDRPPWWGQLQSASQGDHRVDDMVPAKAFDGFFYVDRLTAVKPLAAPGGQ